MRWVWFMLGVTFGIAFFSVPALAQSDYTFDLAEIEKEVEKRPYSLGGFLEFKPSLFILDRDAAFYRLKFYDRNEGKVSEQFDFRLRPEGSLQKGIVSAFARIDALLRYDYEGWDSDETLFEGFITVKPNQNISLDAGKQVLKWGTGYAWNPVSFIARPKNPEDPAEDLEGFVMLNANFVKSFKGPLTTLALTPVLLPVTVDINSDFGEEDHLNVAAKLYFLLWDTDIDLMFFAGGSRANRYGFDFARNLKSNLEIHGEWALITDFEKKTVDREGNLDTERSDVISALVGLRYLTAREMTMILEYYHNGRGLTQSEFEDFIAFVDASYETFVTNGDDSSLRRASKLASGTYAKPNPMRDYLYLRMSQKEPFGLLYSDLALTTIYNLTDRSSVIIPEFSHSPITNLELRWRVNFLVGGSDSEYGEKANDYKIELRARYFF